MNLYSREELIKVLEVHGYIKTDIQRERVAGDMLQFAMQIIIAEKLDEILKK